MSFWRPTSKIKLDMRNRWLTHQLRRPPTERCRLLPTSQYEKWQRSLVRRSNDGVKLAWQGGIRNAVLSKCGGDGTTGCAQAASDLLAGFGGLTGTWTNHSSQIKKWFSFAKRMAGQRWDLAKGTSCHPLVFYTWRGGSDRLRLHSTSQQSRGTMRFFRQNKGRTSLLCLLSSRHVQTKAT